jgi:hypothetical protein
LLSSVLERFALRLCETNAHWALQLSWNVYAALEDNRPGGSLGVHGDPEAYSRAARLLQLIEQSIVYGAKMVNRDSLRSAALAHNIELWRQRVLARVQKLADDVQQLAEHVVPPHTREGEGALPISVPSSQPVGSGGGGVLSAPAAAALQSRSRDRDLKTGDRDLGSARDRDLGTEGGRLVASSAAARASPDGLFGSAVMEGHLLKRRNRDTYGVWRCCGESWTRRWFVLRGSVLFYYRRRSDSRPRGAMPLGQCNLEVRSSPRGDYIAFTKQSGGRFGIGVMRTDGGGERRLSEAYLDEAPTWSPNGRVIMFFREARPGAGPKLWSVDLTGVNLRQVPTPADASDPAWSPLLP